MTVGAVVVAVAAIAVRLGLPARPPASATAVETTIQHLASMRRRTREPSLADRA